MTVLGTHFSQSGRLARKSVAQFAWHGWMGQRERQVRSGHWRGCFFAIISSVEAGDSGLRITARKGECAATFALDMDRTAYFFKDRDVTINDKGSRRKIFTSSERTRESAPAAVSISSEAIFAAKASLSGTGMRF